MLKRKLNVLGINIVLMCERGASCLFQMEESQNKRA